MAMKEMSKMSQYRIGLGGQVVLVVGWDGPLGSFFADVFDYSVDPDDENTDLKDYHLVELGLYTGQEIYTVGELRTLLREAGYELSDELAKKLVSDQMARGSSRFPAQQGGLNMLAALKEGVGDE
jgi:hypothetical protein